MKLHKTQQWMKQLSRFGVVFVLCLPALYLPTWAFAKDSTIMRDLPSILTNLANNLETVWYMLGGLSYLFGIFFCIAGILGLKEYGMRTTFMQVQKGMFPSLFKVLIGATFIFLPTSMDVLMTTFFGMNTSDSFKQWGDTSVNANWDDIFRPLTVLVRVVGLGALIRGLALLPKIGKQNAQPNTMSKAIIHIVGGVFCINIVGTIDILKATLGFN